MCGIILYLATSFFILELICQEGVSLQFVNHINSCAKTLSYMYHKKSRTHVCITIFSIFRNWKSIKDINKSRTIQKLQYVYKLVLFWYQFTSIHHSFVILTIPIAKSLLGVKTRSGQHKGKAIKNSKSHSILLPSCPNQSHHSPCYFPRLRSSLPYYRPAHTRPHIN